MEKQYGIICDIGGKNKGNQDSAFYMEFDIVIAPGSPDSLQFANRCILSMICDGVSASSHGEKGSSFVVKHLPQKIMNYLLSENINLSELHNVVEKAIFETNNELINEFSDFIQKGHVPKTTLVGFLIIGQWIWVFNLGDSRAYLIKDDQISQISTDHIGTGATHEITEAMGQELIHPEIKVYNWAYETNTSSEHPAFNSFYYGLLCSDGLTDKVSHEEIKSTLLQREENQSMQELVQNLYILSMEREIDDNISIIAIDMKHYFQNISKVQKIRLTFN